MAVETATEACSAAFIDGDNCVEKYLVAPRQHTAIILPMIDELLQENNTALENIDCIAFGAGPGSFIGVRVAASLAQGLAFGAQISVIPVSSLQALAQAAFYKHHLIAVAAIIDARMQQCYYGVFKLDANNIMQLQGVEVVADPDIIQKHLNSNHKGIATVGSGAVAYFDSKFALFPDAKSVATIAQNKYQNNKNAAVAPELALPSYIRNKVTS